jgi:ATP/maltotriose-dependent transcriptional regulator MalT
VSPILAAELALASGDVDGAVRRLALIARAGTDGNKELLPYAARGAALHAEIDLLRGRPGDARLRVEQALLNSAGPTSAEGRAHLLIALAAIDDHEGHPTAVRAALTRAVGALASSDVSSDELSAVIEARRAYGLAREGRLGEARTTLDEALARTRGLDAVPVVEEVNESRAALDVVRGDCEAAVRRLGGTVSARRGRGDELGALCAEISLAEVEIRRGDLARAAELATAGKAQATRLGFQALADRAAVVLAAVDLGEMRLERARETTEAVGTLAEEAAKLLAAAETWWREHAPTPPEHVGPECRVCPICQVLAVVRGAQPELFEHLSEAAANLLLAFKDAVDAQERAFGRRRADVPVERIDIL